MADGPFGFTAREWRALQRLQTPRGVQRLLDSLTYHEADTAWSPKRVLREGTAHCLEGGMLAAAALRAIGFPPLVIDLEGERDNDHIVAVYRMHGHWGAIAKSHFTGLRDRMPIYRTLRELAMSYFDDYFNYGGERTLRTYSRPVNLSRFDHLRWMTSEKAVWFIPEYLIDIPHTRLISRAQEKRLYRVDRLSLDAGLLGYANHKPSTNGARLRVASRAFKGQ
jgi:hypothetical protein